MRGIPDLFGRSWRGVVVCAALLAPGCASQGQLDEAVDARRVAEQRRQEAEREVLHLRERGAHLERRVVTLEEEQAAARYEADVALRERESAEATVEQLRVELARVGEHIRHFASRNTELERVGARLDSLERDVEHRLTTLAALTARVGQLSKSSGVAIMVQDGYPAVRFAAGSAVSARGLSKEAKRAVAALVEVLEVQPGSELVTLHASGDDASRSVATTIAEAVRAGAPHATIDVLEAEGVDPGVGFAIVRRHAAESEAGP